MNRMAIFIIAIATILFHVTLVAQEIAVTPGYGTLNDAYAANGGNKIYKLQAGGWYGLSATLNIDEPLTIIGDPVVSGQMPAMIQMGLNADGTNFGVMFSVFADINFKNVFLVNADLNSVRGAIVFNQLSDSRIVLDGVTVDPIGAWILVNIITNHSYTYFTNCLFMRHSTETSGIYDYPLINYIGATGYDTLYVENSTFVDIGFNFYNALVSFQRGTEAPDHFIWFNHNSFLFGKSDILNAFYTDSQFFTNNLLWEYGIQPYTNDFSIWFLNFGDEGSNNTRTSLIKADTVENNGIYETFPSQRRNFVAYNYNYRDPRINDLIKLGADSGHVSYLLPFVSPPSMVDVSREARMFSDGTNFPYFVAAKNIEDQPNTDPQFTDPKIYTLTDSAVAWANSATKLFWGFPEDSYPPRENWARYYYNVDPELGFPITWPRINGAYSNEQLLTASIEGLPLGDLNWFPDKKAIWQAHQAEIMDHILSVDSSVINITSIEQSDNQQPLMFSLSQNYPNPFNPTTVIKYGVPESGIVTLKVFNMLGQEVATLVNQEQLSGNYVVDFDASKLASGVYMYRIQAGDFSSTKKMTLLK